MPLIPHSITRRTTNFTTSSTTPVTVNTIASTEFVVGRKYLLHIVAQWGGGSTGNEFGLDVAHGGTVFDGSNGIVEPAIVEPEKYTYSFFTVWTAVATESIELRATSIDGSAMDIDLATLIALEISEELTEGTDWHFDENGTNEVLPVAPIFTSVSNASITFTPPNAGDTWIILGQAQIIPVNLVDQLFTRIARTGEATENFPLFSQEAEDNQGNDILPHLTARSAVLDAVSQTFESQSAEENASGATRDHSAIFALNLSKFTSFAQQFIQGAISIDTTNAFATSTEVATATHTPITAQSFTWIFGSFSKSPSELSGFDHVKARLQYDNADAPANQTSNDFEELSGWDDEDKLSFRLSDIIVNPAVSPHDIDVDATTSATQTEGDRLVFAVELAILVTNTQNFDVDAIIVNKLFNTFDTDAILLATFDRDYDVDAFISTIINGDFLVDTLIGGQGIKFFQVDSFLSAIINFDFLVDAVLNITFDFDVDAILEPAHFFAVDAVIRGQLSVPISPDIAVDGWTPTPLFPELDEEPFDGSQITLSGAGFGQPELFQVTMLPVQDPIFSTGNEGKDHKIRALCRSTQGSLAVQLILFQNVTEVARSPFLRVEPAGVFVTKEYTLTAAEANAITDYSALRIRVIPAVVGDPVNTFGVDAVLI